MRSLMLIKRLFLSKRSLAWVGMRVKTGRKTSLQWVVEDMLLKIMSPTGRCRLLEAAYPTITAPIFKLPVFTPPIYPPPQGRKKPREEWPMENGDRYPKGEADGMIPIPRMG